MWNKMNTSHQEEKLRTLSELVEEMQPFIDNIPNYRQVDAFENFSIQLRNLSVTLLSSVALFLATGIHGSINNGTVSMVLLGSALVVFTIGFIRGLSLLYASSDGGLVTSLTSWTGFALQPVTRMAILGNIDRKQLFEKAMNRHKELVKQKASELQQKLDTYNNLSHDDEVAISELGYVKLKQK